MTLHLWLGRPGEEVLRSGTARELAEQAADESYDRMMAPPCPACGRAVKDEDYERHRRVDHADNEVVQPAGKPNSREVVLQAYDTDDLERKLARYRALHPGVGLALLGDGTRIVGEHKKVTLIWRRWRVLDGRGRPAS
jgi:hypothetical protein